MTKDVVDMHNTIRPGELETLLRHQVQQLLAKPGLAKLLPPLMVWGAPGLGKSTILRKVAEEAGIQFLDIRLAQREPVDVRGLPVPDQANNCVRWLVSSDWPRDPKSKGIILFDELTAADRSLQVAAYELILDRRLGDLYQVPDGWYICAAGNRIEDQAVAMTMSSALANRFLHVELEQDVDDWIKWGLVNDVHPAVLGFLRYRPDLLCHLEKENLERGWPSPRSWERVSTMLKTFDLDNESLLNTIIYGLVGNGAGVEFVAYKKLSDEFEDVKQLMLSATAEVQIPKEADRRFAFCAAISYYLWRGKNAKEEKQLLDGFYRISVQLPSDFATMLMMDAICGNTKAPSPSYFAEKLYRHPGYAGWAKQHGKAMRAKMELHKTA